MSTTGDKERITIRIDDDIRAVMTAMQQKDPEKTASAIMLEYIAQLRKKADLLDEARMEIRSLQNSMRVLQLNNADLAEWKKKRENQEITA